MVWGDAQCRGESGCSVRVCDCGSVWCEQPLNRDSAETPPVSWERILSSIFPTQTDKTPTEREMPNSALCESGCSVRVCGCDSVWL